MQGVGDGPPYLFATPASVRGLQTMSKEDTMKKLIVAAVIAFNVVNMGAAIGSYLNTKIECDIHTWENLNTGKAMGFIEGEFVGSTVEAVQAALADHLSPYAY